MSTYKILQGSALERLRELPDDSVHCIITSPPYWGLRDYGTGRWEGGDSSCSHIKGEMRRGVNLAASAANTRGGAKKIAQVTDIPFGEICGHCGARRVDEQIGLEDTPEEFVAKLVEVFRECRRVLRGDGTCWINIGDSYTSGGRDSFGPINDEDKQASHSAIKDATRPPMPRGMKPKDLVGIPWMLAFALRADGWYLRQNIIWAKANPMPESVKDRCTKAHEDVFLLSKKPRYFYDAEAIKEPVAGTANDRGEGVNPKAHGANSRMSVDRDVEHARRPKIKQNRSFSAAISGGLVTMRNRRDVWEIATESYSEAHFATFPTELVVPCIRAGTSEKGCCRSCGAPIRRIVRTIKGGSKDCPKTEAAAEARGGRGESSTVGQSGSGRVDPITETVGWEPTCGCCETVAVPCVVMDPFSGAGTTGLVAQRLGRSYIGTELNPEYVEMSRARIQGDAPLFRMEAVDAD